MLHLEDSFIFLFLNSCIASRGEIITNLSILHVVLFLFGVLHYERLHDAAVGDAALVSLCRASGQRSRVDSYLHLWDACGMLSQRQLQVVQRPTQMDVNSLPVLV